MSGAKKLVIIGTGGMGRDTQWLIERINQSADEPVWDIIGFLDDNTEVGTDVNGLKVLGKIDCLYDVKTELAVVCTIACADTRKRITDKLRSLPHLYFPNIIDPAVICSDRVDMGMGNIICAGAVVSVNINIDSFCIICVNCTVGHDSDLSSFVTLYPGVNVSGNVRVGECTEIGTGSQVLQGLSVGQHTKVGAGAVVINDIKGDCTVVGVPAKPVNK